MALLKCNKATIFFHDMKTPICNADVEVVSESLVTLVIEEEFMDALDSEMPITFFDSVQGLVTYKCQLSNPKRFLQNGLWLQSIDCMLDEVLSTLQRREDFKVNVDLPINIVVPSTLELEDNVRGLTEIGDLRLLDGKVVNISAGGIFFETSLLLPTENPLVTIISVATKQTIELNVKVLRVIMPEDDAEDKVYGYGCKFVRLGASTEQSLRSFVYQQQMRRREAYR